MSEVNNIYKVFEPLHFISKLSGIYSFSLSNNLKFNKIGLGIQLIKITLYLIYFISSSNFYEENVDVLDKTIASIQLIGLCLLLFIYLINLQVTCKIIFEIFKEINMSDSLLEELELATDYKKLLHFSYRGVFVNFFVVAFIGAIEMNLSYFLTRKAIIMFCIYIFIYVLMENNFYFLLFDLRFRFKLINKKLKQVLCAEQSINLDVLNKIILTRGRLLRICQKVNRVFNVSVTCGLLWAFRGSVYSLYFLMAFDLNDTLLKTLLSSYWLIFNVFDVVFLIYMVTSVTTKVYEEQDCDKPHI